MLAMQLTNYGIHRTQRSTETTPVKQPRACCPAMIASSMPREHLRMTENRRLAIEAPAMRARIMTRSTLRVLFPLPTSARISSVSADMVACGWRCASSRRWELRRGCNRFKLPRASLSSWRGQFGALLHHGPGPVLALVIGPSQGYTSPTVPAVLPYSVRAVRESDAALGLSNTWHQH